MSLGILVHGSNHFILRGPKPTTDEAKALVQRWEFPSTEDLLHPPPPDPRWQISTREFRENLQWAVLVEADTPITSAVQQLLSELASRGIRV